MCAQLQVIEPVEVKSSEIKDSLWTQIEISPLKYLKIFSSLHLQSIRIVGIHNREFKISVNGKDHGTSTKGRINFSGNDHYCKIDLACFNLIQDRDSKSISMHDFCKKEWHSNYPDVRIDKLPMEVCTGKLIAGLPLFLIKELDVFYICGKKISDPCLVFLNGIKYNNITKSWTSAQEIIHWEQNKYYVLNRETLYTYFNSQEIDKMFVSSIEIPPIQKNLKYFKIEDSVINIAPCQKKIDLCNMSYTKNMSSVISYPRGIAISNNRILFMREPKNVLEKYSAKSEIEEDVCDIIPMENTLKLILQTNTVTNSIIPYYSDDQITIL